MTEIDPEAMQALLEHAWPGNVRELENAIKAAVAMADGTVIHRDVLPARPSPRRPAGAPAAPSIDIDRPLPDVTDDLVGQVERDYFTQLLARYKRQRRPLRPAQRPLAPERHPEAPEVRARPHPLQDGPLPRPGRRLSDDLP